MDGTKETVMAVLGVRYDDVTYADIVRAVGRTPDPRRCDGSGTVRVMSDMWDECGGCLACYRQDIRANSAFAVGDFIWRAAHTKAHAELAETLVWGHCLAVIGRVIMTAVNAVNAVSGFVFHVAAGWNEVAVGRFVQVTGKRGKAKEHQGKSGEVKWMGISGGKTYQGYRTNSGFTVGGTMTVGLKIAGHEKLVYVAATQCTRVPTPFGAVVAKKVREERIARAVVPYRGGLYHVVGGAHAGKSGRVFWVGDGRCGLDPDVNRKRGKCPDPMWVSNADLSLEPLTVGSEQHVEVEVACHFLTSLLRLCNVEV